MQAVESSAKQARTASLTPVPGGQSIGGSGALPIPAGIPEVVQKVIAGANEIADFPYVFGGGHGSFVDNAYDCSGSVSYALAAGGLLRRTRDLRRPGELGRAGPGPLHHGVRERRAHLHVRRRRALRHGRPQRRVRISLAGRSGGQRGLRRASLAGPVGSGDGGRSRFTSRPSCSRWTANRRGRATPGSAIISVVSMVFGYLLLAALWYFVFSKKARARRSRRPKD